MIQQIKGIITDATPLGTIETRTGRKTEKCILHIRTADIDPNKVQEIAVGVHGDNAKFQFLIGTMVTVEYIVRVFTFLKNGRRQLGNDIYCKSIKTSIHENQM